jgi:hypothetical protein
MDNTTAAGGGRDAIINSLRESGFTRTGSARDADYIWLRSRLSVYYFFYYYIVIYNPIHVSDVIIQR